MLNFRSLFCIIIILCCAFVNENTLDESHTTSHTHIPTQVELCDGREKEKAFILTLNILLCDTAVTINPCTLHLASESSEWSLTPCLGLEAPFVINVARMQWRHLATRCHHSSSLGTRRGKCWNSSGTSSPFWDLL